MAYTNSPLVVYTKLSPNHSGQRTHSIDRITPHCVVGQLSAESICGCFISPDRQASCNYGIGSDGRVSLCVEEKNRSWCTSSRENDQRAITIECASDSKHPYAFRDAVYTSLINLCIDICKRNSKSKLLWLGDKDKTLNYIPKADEMVLTVHRWFANKSCVPVNSEVLTRNGWVKLRDINVGDEIACATLDGLRISFEEVLDKVEERKQDTYTSNGLTATMDHRMVYSVQQSKDVFRIDYYKRLLNAGNNIYIPVAGHLNADGLPLTDEMLTFLVAVQADGHYMYEKRVDGSKSYYGVEFHLRKERKIERLISCLEACHFEYNVGNQSDGTKKIRLYNTEDVNIVKDVCELWLHNKCFTWDWLNLSEHQARLVLDEILLWDGCTAANLYTSKENINLDVISALAAVNGVGGNVTGSNIQFRQNPYITLGESKRNARGDQTIVSCVTVKTGIFLCRQNGKTFIIGNCPGDWMYARMGDLASKVTAALNAGTDTTPTDTTPPETENNTPAIDVTDPEKTIWNTLQAAIGNAYGTAGLMGNLYAESALKPGNLQNTGNKALGMTDEQFVAAVDSGEYSADTFIHDGYGMGLAQWTYYTRKQALLNFVKAAGKSIGDLETQLAFLLQEIKGYTSVWNTLTAATSVREASDAVLIKYERPANQSESVQVKRAGYGQQYYDKYAGASTTAWYRVRKSWDDAQSQKGAFHDLTLAKACADSNPGYSVFDESGQAVYTPASGSTPAPTTSFTYKVRVRIDDLNIRKGPGTNYASRGYTGAGIFTIVEEADGPGATRWGLLKSYQSKRNGWISLEYAAKL